MIDPNQIRRKNTALAKLAGEKFSFEPSDLRQAMRRVGRRLPKKAHRMAQVLIDAENRAGHPKIRLQINTVSLESAYEELRGALESVDPADRRKGLVLSTLAMVSVNVIAVFTLLIVVLVWRGYL